LVRQGEHKPKTQVPKTNLERPAECAEVLLRKKPKRGFSTAQADTFAGSERERKMLGLLRSK
jgi:hypothetical protein